MIIFSWLKRKILYLLGLAVTIFSGVHAGIAVPTEYVIQKHQEHEQHKIEEKKEDVDSRMKNIHPENRNIPMVCKPYKISNKNLNSGRKRF